MDQKSNNPSAALTVLSIIAFATSAIAMIFAILFVIIVNVGPESGGTATALTGRAVLTVSGMILFTAATWGFGMLGTLMGFVMTIVDLAKRSFRIVWMPIAAVVLGIAGPVIIGMIL